MIALLMPVTSRIPIRPSSVILGLFLSAATIVPMIIAIVSASASGNTPKSSPKAIPKSEA